MNFSILVSLIDIAFFHRPAKNAITGLARIKSQMIPVIVPSMKVNAKYPLPTGFDIHVSNTLDSMSYDGVNYYSIQSGMYTCRLKVYMDGALCKEINGEIIEEPIACQVKYKVY